jgi:hypothetical protein
MATARFPAKKQGILIIEVVERYPRVLSLRALKTLLSPSMNAAIDSADFSTVIEPQ